MKAVAFSIRPFEKEYLAKANQKKHEITLISNTLSTDTAIYAEGKQVAIVSGSDEVSAQVIEKLAGLGIKYITTRSAESAHIDKTAASQHGIKLANVPLYSSAAESLQDNANQTIKNLDQWQQNKCVNSACICSNNCAVKHR